MTVPEFSRTLDTRQLPASPVALSATPEECAALAARFGLVALPRLDARVTLAPSGAAIVASGRLCAELVQSCAVSGEDLPVTIDEPFALRFVPAAAGRPSPPEEVEIAPTDPDEIAFEGSTIELGEALAQSLALAIDPYATGPQADAVRDAHGLGDEGAAGPLAEALRALKRG